MPNKKTPYHGVWYNIGYYRSWFEFSYVHKLMVKCEEEDDNIFSCSSQLLFIECDHSQDVWLQCKGKFRMVSTDFHTLDGPISVLKHCKLLANHE
jgi:hypothetical protein